MKTDDCEPRLNGQRFYSLRDVAAMLGLHPESIRLYLREGRLLGYRLKGTWRISEAQLAAFLESCRGETTAKVDQG